MGEKMMKDLLSVIWVVRDIGNLESDIVALQRMLAGRHAELVIVSDAEGALDFSNVMPAAQVITHDHAHGPAAAFMEGTDAAHGDRILYIESQFILQPSGLAAMERVLRRNEHAGLVAPVQTGVEHNRVREVPDYRDLDGMMAFAHQIEQKHRGRVTPELLHDDGCFLVRRAALRDVQPDTGFQTSQGMAGDFALRLWQAGWKVLAADDVYVHRNGIRDEGDFAADAQLFQERHGFDISYSTNVRRDVLTNFHPAQPPKAILEAGCAAGGTLCYLQGQFPEAELYGIELNDRAAAVARIFADVRAMDLEQLDHPAWNDKCDVILMGDILEHLRDPWQTVRNMYRMTRPGGQILISVPNITYISVFYEMLRGQWHYEDAGILDRTHLRFFTRATARELLTQAGYRIADDGWTLPALPAEMQSLKQKLLPLLGPGVEPEELDAYQWIFFGEK